MNEDIRSIMEEPSGGENHGRKGTEIRVKDDEILGMRLTPLQLEGAAFMQTEGWNLATFGGHDDGGLTGHRGVLQDGEYVDPFVLREAACDLLGFEYEDISSVYRQGPLTPEQRQLRARIDARVLALSRSRGNMQQLANALGLNEKTIDRAVSRAKVEEVVPIVKNPAVKTDRVCFIHGTRDARPRKRRFSKSPEQWVGTINLCDECYADGFESRPGNPRYWEHRLATSPIRGGVAPGPARRKQTFPADWPSDESYAAFVGRG